MSSDEITTKILIPQKLSAVEYSSHTTDTLEAVRPAVHTTQVPNKQLLPSWLVRLAAIVAIALLSLLML